MIGALAFMYAATGLVFAAVFWVREIPRSVDLARSTLFEGMLDVIATLMFGAIYGIIWPVVALAMLKRS